MSEIKQIKICIKALEKENAINSSLYKNLGKKLICLYALDENLDAINFWKNRL